MEPAVDTQGRVIQPEPDGLDRQVKPVLPPHAYIMLSCYPWFEVVEIIPENCKHKGEHRCNNCPDWQECTA